MDVAAVLTLQIASFLQSDAEVPRSPCRWGLVPGFGRGEATFAEAAAHLAQLEKPIVVGALDHPGFVALWRLSALNEAERRHVEHTVRNQQAALAQSTRRLGTEDTDLVLFEGWGSRTTIAVRELRRWLSEYALTWGWRIGAATDDTHCARLLVLQHGRRWSPGDGVCHLPAAT